MKSPDPHIILIGFKHVGKSIIGRMLAQRLHKTHIDLDREIEHLYQMQHRSPLTCREIVQDQGEAFFRDLEQQALQQVIQTAPGIISTGGGTPMRVENCQLLAAHCIIHITAEPRQVFDRIMRKGRPAFFSANEDPWVTFQRLWQEREKVYKQLADFSIENNSSLEITVKDLLKKLLYRDHP